MHELRLDNCRLILGDGIEWVRVNKPSFIVTDPPIHQMTPMAQLCQDLRIGRIFLWADEWLTHQGEHPAEKAIEPFEHVIRMLPVAVIVDPFMGSGTTGIAALKAGMGFIGIEKEEKWFNLACERIKNAIENAAAGEDAA